MKSRKRKANGLYEHPCAYCHGWVQCKVKEREAIRVTKADYVILENVPIGICDTCNARYYHASVLTRAEKVHEKGRRKVQVPVGPYDEAG
ncbi:MAG: hypothetical protein HYY16_13935 [Planctomycetes bacterium]|nr:hypothetical protein [Planctomycetota bacterium]